MISIILFWLVMFLGCLILCVVFGRLARNSGYDDGYVSLSVLCGSISTIGLILALCFTLGPYTLQIKDSTEIRSVEKKIALYTKRRDNLSAVVRAELEKYPKYEKTVLNGIKPEILLSFPELKASDTMIKMVEELVKLENDIYKLREGQLDIAQRMYYREISPWTVHCESYQELIGKPNPVAQ